MKGNQLSSLLCCNFTCSQSSVIITAWILQADPKISAAPHFMPETSPPLKHLIKGNRIDRMRAFIDVPTGNHINFQVGKYLSWNASHSCTSRLCRSARIRVEKISMMDRLDVLGRRNLLGIPCGWPAEAVLNDRSSPDAPRSAMGAIGPPKIQMSGETRRLSWRPRRMTFDFDPA